MAEQWYWKHQGETTGPLRTEELERLVGHHRVFDGDQVQLAGSDEWLTGADLKALFEKRDKTSSAEAASQLLERAARRQLNRPVEASAGAVTEALRRTMRRTKAVAGGLVEGVSHVLSSLLAMIAPLFNRTVLAIVLGATLIAAAASQMDFGGLEHPRIYLQLTEAYRRLQEMEELAFEVTLEERRDFQVQTRAWLDPTIESLEEANATFPVNSSRHAFGNKYTALARLSLLDAAKALRSMLDEGPTASGRVWQFEQAMGGANQFITGQPDPRYPAPNEQYSIANDGTAGDTTTRILIIVGVGLVAGALVSRFRRHRTV